MDDFYSRFASAIQAITLYAIPLLLGFTWHVAAQCYAANRLGDKTAQQLGRLSLNPTKHIDPVGTVLIPVICFLVLSLTGMPLMFGYAKPLPVDFGKLRQPKRDMLWIAAAGIAANFLMALVWYLLRNVLIRMEAGDGFFTELKVFLIKVASVGPSANLVLIAVYLIPLLPFDGGRIIFSLLPHRKAFEFSKIEPYTMFIVGLLLLSGILQRIWIGPIASLFEYLLGFVLIPFNLLFS